MTQRISVALFLTLTVLTAAPAAPETAAPEPAPFQVVRKRDTRQLAAMLDVDAASVIKSRGTGGSTLLHLAAAQDDTQSLQLLIARGAGVDTPADNNATPLHWAANCNAASAARTLIDNGANVNARTSRDFVPLHWAALGNATNVIAVLLERGAVPNLRNDEGRTPLDLAVEKKADQAATALRAALSRQGPKAAAAQASSGAGERHWWTFWKRPAKAQPGRQTTTGQPKAAPPAPPVTPAPVRKPAPAPQTVASVTKVTGPATTGQTHVVTFKDGSAYEGAILQGKFHGFGTLMMASGDMYRGAWEKGERQGAGEYAFADGERYKGDWTKGRMWGKGVYIFANGSRIEGTWQNNSLLHGEGTFRFSNGDQYTGEWQRDRPWGKGVYAAADGRNFAGYFVNGRFVGPNPPAADPTLAPLPERSPVPLPGQP